MTVPIAAFTQGTTAPGIGISGATLTTSYPLFDGAQTWNNAGVVFTGFKLNVTDTNSDASSLLMDLQVAGLSQLSVRKDGVVLAAQGLYVATGSMWVKSDDPTFGSFFGSALDVKVGRGGTGILAVTTEANGQKLGIQTLTELTTIAAAATTDTAIQIPANAIVLGVSVRVTVVIPTAATFTVIGTTSSTAFQTGVSVSTAATTTDAGTKSCPYLNATAQTIRITPNAQPASNTGRVRVTIHYIAITPPTA